MNRTTAFLLGAAIASVTIGCNSSQVGQPTTDEPLEPSSEAFSDAALLIQGTVLSVAKDQNHVVLSVGAKDGVKQGYAFHISRGGQYMGRVCVEKAHGDSSSAVITGTKGSGAIAQGDLASLDSCGTVCPVPPCAFPVPRIDAAVLTVDADENLVWLNVGSNDGVKRGFTFHVYRGSRYKGDVRVENVEDDFCAAVVIMAAESTVMAQGDRATTIL